MDFTFANPKVQELAKKPLTFENWVAFRQAMIDSCELPACYDLPVFENPESFEYYLGIKIASKIFDGQSALGVAVSSAMIAATLVIASDKITILQLLQIEPRVILK